MSETAVPQVRFEGFDGEWDERAFGDIAHRNARTVTDEGLPQVEYEDIDSGFGSLNKDLRRKNTVKAGVEFQPGDVLFGKLRPYLKNWLLPDFRGIAVGDFWALRGNGCVSAFLYDLIQGPKFTAVSNISSGSKMPRSDWELVSQTPFMVPESVEEQSSIGALFSGLDTLIGQHRRKHEQLQQTKVALMQRVFPQTDTDGPELRFDDFSGAWKVISLLDAVDSIVDFRGRTPKKLGMDWSETGHLALSANNVKHGYIDFSRDQHYGDDCLYTKWMAGRELHKGQVLFTTEAPMGNVARVPDSRKYILSQRVIAFEVVQSRVTEDFLAVALGSPSVFAQLTALSSGGTAQGVSQRSLVQVKFPVPTDLEEQQRIAAAFNRFDYLIAAEQQYIDKLQQVKASLLQKMFI